MKDILNPKRFDISLVFFKDNNKYPQKGSIVRLDHKIFCEHIEEVESSRTEKDVDMFGETFCLVTQSYKKMFYNNSFNSKYPYLRSDIPLVVEEIYFDSNEVIMARCRANGYKYPSDSNDDFSINLIADDLDVVDIVLCDYIGVYSEESPNDDYMSIYDKDASKNSGLEIYQMFKIREDYKYADILKNQVIEYGLKEFSYIYPVDPLTKKPVYLDDKSDSEPRVIEDFDYPTPIERLSMEHPLSNYTKRMFASVMENIGDESLSDEEINDIYFDMLSVMLNTSISKNDIVMSNKDLDISDRVDNKY